MPTHASSTWAVCAIENISCMSASAAPVTGSCRNQPSSVAHAFFAAYPSCTLEAVCGSGHSGISPALHRNG